MLLHYAKLQVLFLLQEKIHLVKCHSNSKSLLQREFISVISLCISPGAGSCPQCRGVRNREVSAGQEPTTNQSKFGIVSFSTLAKDGIEWACDKIT